MDDEIKLKLCPFCGGKVVFKVISTYENKGLMRIGFNFKIKCINCGVTLPYSYETMLKFKDNGEIFIESDDREKAARDWNRRADDAHT